MNTRKRSDRLFSYDSIYRTIRPDSPYHGKELGLVSASQSGLTLDHLLSFSLPAFHFLKKHYLFSIQYFFCPNHCWAGFLKDSFFCFIKTRGHISLRNGYDLSSRRWWSVVWFLHMQRAVTRVTLILMYIKPNENWIFIQMELMDFFSGWNMLKLFKFTLSAPIHWLWSLLNPLIR